jgi:hypothetical protein
VDFSKLSREDWMVGGGGILLILSLLIFGWYSVPSVTVAGATYGGGDIAATSSPYAIWGIFALIVTIVIVADLALARFSPTTVIPTTNLGRDMTRAVAAGVVALLLVIKFLAHTGNLGFGFILDVVLTVIVVAGAWLNAHGKTTPIGSPRRSPSDPPTNSF